MSTLEFILLAASFYACIRYGRTQGRREAQRELADSMYRQQAAFLGANVTRLRK